MLSSLRLGSYNPNNGRRLSPADASLKTEQSEYSPSLPFDIAIILSSRKIFVNRNSLFFVSRTAKSRFDISRNGYVEQVYKLLTRHPCRAVSFEPALYQSAESYRIEI